MTMYPLQRIAKERIVPTEIDSFRHQIIMFMIWELQWKVELDMPEFFQIVWMLLK
jgi:hypothetical protein